MLFTIAYAVGVRKQSHLFRDHLSKVEYQISALCQTCQDQTFGGSDETN